MKTMRLAPGDKVRITQSAFENDLVDNTLVATEGSLGAVLSYETYCDYIHNSCSADFAREHLPLVKKCINEGTQYPVRFEMVVPPPEELCEYWRPRGRFFVECEVGKVVVLHVMFLEKMSA